MFTVKEQAFFFLFLASFSTILASWIVFVVLLAGHKIEPDTHSLRLFSLVQLCLFLSFVGTSRNCSRIIEYHRSERIEV